MPDAETGLERAENFYKGRESEPHVKEVFQRLGDIYFDQTKYPEAIAVYKAVLQKWPYYAEAPRDPGPHRPRLRARPEHGRWPPRSARCSAAELQQGQRVVQRQNQDNPEALAAAQQLSEDALLTAATNVHAAAQACRASGAENRRRQEARRVPGSCTAPPRELYEKYLAAYPNSKRSLRVRRLLTPTRSTTRGSCPRRSRPTTAVRDSKLDNQLPGGRGLPVIKAYEEIIERDEGGASSSTTRPSPTRRTPSRPSRRWRCRTSTGSTSRPSTGTSSNIKDDRVPDLRYAAAVIAAALSRLGRGARPAGAGHRAVLRHQAGDRLQGLRRPPADLLHRLQRPGRGAEGLRPRQLLPVAEQFGESACGKSPAAKPYLARITQIKSSVKTTSHHQAPQARRWRTRRRGRTKQLVMCQSGPGGIAIVTGAAQPAKAGRSRRRRPRRRRSSSTELDVGLALDLIDLVNQNPKDPGAPTDAQQRLRHLREAVPVRRGDQVLRAPVRTTIPTPSGARKRSGTPRATTTGSSSSTRRSRAT